MGCTSNTDTAPRSQIANVEDKAGSSVGWACLVVNKSLPYERAVFLSHIQSSLFTYISEVNAVKMLTSRFHNAISPTKAVLSWSQPNTSVAYSQAGCDDFILLVQGVPTVSALLLYLTDVCSGQLRI